MITTVRLLPGCGTIHCIAARFIPLPLLPFFDLYIGQHPPCSFIVIVAAALYTEILYEVLMIWLNSKLHIRYRLSTRIVLRFVGLCVHACTYRNSIPFMHAVINRVTAWFRIFLGLPTVIHLVAKFCAGLDLRGPSLSSGKPTARPYPSSVLHKQLMLWILQ
jgi:hypothetical protein